MTDESCIGNPSKIMQDSDELLTLYSLIQGHQPCSLKILWKSHVSAHISMVFPIGSPLLPFFNYAYNKIRQTGALHRIKKKWMFIEHRCQSNPLQPISFHKTVSLFKILLLGICWTLIILVIEVCFEKKVQPV